jgi:hypothetical protein
VDEGGGIFAVMAGGLFAHNEEDIEGGLDDGAGAGEGIT